MQDLTSVSLLPLIWPTTLCSTRIRSTRMQYLLVQYIDIINCRETVCTINVYCKCQYSSQLTVFFSFSKTVW